jgi:hypothetical protein
MKAIRNTIEPQNIILCMYIFYELINQQWTFLSISNNWVIKPRCKDQHRSCWQKGLLRWSALVVNTKQMWSGEIKYDHQMLKIQPFVYKKLLAPVSWVRAPSATRKFKGFTRFLVNPFFVCLWNKVWTSWRLQDLQKLRNNSPLSW